MLFLNFTKQPTKTRKTTLVSDKILAKFNPGETRGPMQHKKKYLFSQVKYGEEAWDNVRRLANIDTPTFSIHHVG